MPRGYAEGPAAEAAEARLDALERGETDAPHLDERAAVYGCTEDEPERHFLGWAAEVDPDELFASGRAWGISIVRTTAEREVR
ncbi:MAG: hypothetical protein ICV64_12790 [Thermoleophilia bacterium]|nr:hypothetical protein [Thermoleophilia bacterium]